MMLGIRRDRTEDHSGGSDMSHIKIIHNTAEVREAKRHARAAFEEACRRANTHIPDEYLNKWWG